MRASRLLSMLMLLQSRERMSAPAMAAELGVSVRTVYRDMDELGAAGVPVTVERGATGGFALVEGWRTRLTGFTAEEAQAVFLGGLPGPAAQLGLDEAMRSAQLKLLAALPAAEQADARRVAARLHLDPVGWYQVATRVDHLHAIAHAVWRDERLRIRYESWKGIVERTIDPLGLVLKAGDWYVVARVDGDLRTYRVSSVLAVAGGIGRFARPRKFDLERHWAASIERFEAGIYRGVATVRVSDKGMAQLRGMSAAVAAATEQASKRRDREGWRRVTIPIESTEQAARALLVLGSDGEVLAPRELREEIARAVRTMARRYRA